MYLNRQKFLVLLIFFFYGCEIQEPLPKQKPVIAVALSPSPKPFSKPKQIEKEPNADDQDPLQKPDETQEKPEETKTVGTDSEVFKTNVNWKEFNPVAKGKKFTYLYSIKEGKTEIKTETLWEITEIAIKNYRLKQTILTSGKEAQLRSTEVLYNINSDGSPAIIPIVPVAGESLKNIAQVEVNEKIEKITVPAGNFETIKVVAKSDKSISTNWYGKGVGLIKAIQTSDGAVYTLELKSHEN